MVVVLVLVGMIQGGTAVGGGKKGCGGYGPLEWFNAPPNEYNTALFGSPMGMLLESGPFAFGCSPTLATMFSPPTYHFTFNYSTPDLLSKIVSSVWNFTAVYSKKSSEQIFISSYTTVNVDQMHVNGQFTYGTAAPFNLYNTSQDTVKLRLIMSAAYTYQSHNLPTHPSQVMFYRNSVKYGQDTHNYTLTKGGLIAKDEVKRIEEGSQATITRTLEYNAEGTLLERVEEVDSRGATENQTYEYDSSNRLTDMNISRSDGRGHFTRFLYSSSGDLVSYVDYFHNLVRYNVSFFY